MDYRIWQPGLFEFRAPWQTALWELPKPNIRWTVRHHFTVNKVSLRARVDYLVPEFGEPEEILAALREGRLDPEAPRPFRSRKATWEQHLRQLAAATVEGTETMRAWQDKMAKQLFAEAPELRSFELTRLN